MKKNNLKGSLILCLTALIWGLAFVAQTEASDKIPPFAFNSIRSFIGAAFLLLLLLISGKRKNEEIIPKTAKEKKEMIIGGIVCGVMLFISVNLQQTGLTSYPSGVAAAARGGFLTALYVVIVPVISIFLGRKPSLAVFSAVGIAIVGIYMLCMTTGFEGIYIGDILMMLCALAFSIHIFTVDRFGEKVGGIKLSFIQFLVCGAVSGIVSLFVENLKFANVLAAAPQILYLGIMSSGIAYTLQIIGQNYAEPAVASLSMSLESVFAALGGWIILKNRLSLREIAGCALVFVAIILAQLPEMIKKEKV